MSQKYPFLNFLLVVIVMIGGFPFLSGFKPAQAAVPEIRPVVAVHFSEYTQALESLPASGAVPKGKDTTGKSWFPTCWNYDSIVESIKIALESDGTPYQVVSDAEIASGELMAEGVPKYPIVISLAAEAVADDEIQPLRDYVSAGGFLFVGSSAFTRRPDGSSRGDFALAAEMGLRMVEPSLLNWVSSSTFNHWQDHRLIPPIPRGTVSWNMLSNADEIVWNTNGAQQLWQTLPQGAEVLATGARERPLLATRGYGAGRFIYHAIFNPIVGAGGQDAGMYAYSIYRSAIEWAFESANLPLLRKSPWPYEYDAAFIIRHDFENLLKLVMDIEPSARFEHSIGAKGDYYFTTGILRTMKSAERKGFVDSVRRAVSLYGATLGPHNGGFPNPDVKDPGLYEYWHWGPDQMLDRTNFGPNFTKYTRGVDYARDSIQISYEDVEEWMKGLDNGRAGCGSAGNCPRIWVSPFFNSGREASLKILADKGVITVGEQKISPFPHWTLSYNPETPGNRYPTLSIPVSEWFIGSRVAQSIESNHTPETIRALVDFYYQKGYLINLYGHSGSEAGLMNEYASYVVKKPRVWASNSVGLYDWWVQRDRLQITPTFSTTGEMAVATFQISGAAGPGAAVELSLPYAQKRAASDLEVSLDGKPADPGDYRLTASGLKVRVSPGLKTVEVRYIPLLTWAQSRWRQQTWSVPAAGGIAANQFTLTGFNTGGAGSSAGDTGGELTGLVLVKGAYTPLTGAAPRLGYAYKATPIQPVGDYSVEVDLRFSRPGAAGGGLAGRLNPATGQRYAVWVNPAGSFLRLVRFSGESQGAAQRLSPDMRLPEVGSGWHHLKLVFNGSRIRVFYDHDLQPLIDVQDLVVHQTGIAGLDFWLEAGAAGPSFNNFRVYDLQGNEWFRDEFGEDPLPPEILSRWADYQLY